MTTTIYQLVEEKEFYRVAVGLKLGGVEVDPTPSGLNLTVKFAVTAIGVKPVSADWKTGSWVTEEGEHIAHIMVGGTGSGATIELPDEDIHDVWFLILSPPESMPRKIDQIRAA